MTLDTTTLTIAGGFVAFMAGLLLAGAWTQIPRAPALAWWAIAGFLNAFGIVALAVGTAGLANVRPIGVELLVVSPAIAWAGLRRFNGRPISVSAVVAGVAAWVAVDLLVPPARHALAGAFSFVPEVIYLIASAYELWRGRDEQLRGRYGLLAVMLLHAATLAGGVVDTLNGVMAETHLPVLDSWFGIINFESLFYSMASAVFMVLLTKERSERDYKVAAREDALTGIANRRALLENGERLLRRCKVEGRSLSLIMFDLDHFKWVNDTFGHASGDGVLRAFAATVQSALRPADLFGRYGGEEFVAILPGATAEAAVVIAERVRNSFAQLSILASEHQMHATVSAGVAAATSSAQTLEAIIRVADAALYRAKELGRNRVERQETAVRPAAAVEDIRVA